ncbi:hypothetical protein [Caldithrix abyssi]|uniref:Transmembrane protein (PGPGW) n=1 Tax=Caldithrix abyssi DSM 13497 TaxID=880073 RepID=H1XQ77_CALAY|nr:hypothetical protein [Caldithrix abyssi]APF19495.1 hypothetical protein Cabys_2747 [Caldithrix abyssi DSM 13497]EHO43382.1 hypothetical protein Calab_3785 [Caldithrix abyssi DSM 13497]
MKAEKQKDVLTKVKKFRKRKIFWVILLVFLGMVGALIPIIPGALFIILAIALVRRGWMEKIRKYL